MQTRIKAQSLLGPVVGLVAFALASIAFLAPTPAQAFCNLHFGCPPPGSPESAPLSLQAAGQIAQGVAQVSLTGIQHQIWSIEDRLDCLTHYTDRSGVWPNPCLQRRSTARSSTAFAAEGSANPDFDSAFSALAYSGKQGNAANPMFVKATPPPAPLQPSVSYSVWGQGSADSEVRRGNFAGSDIGSGTRTWSGVAGADVTFLGVTSTADALVFGLIGGDTKATTHNADGTVMNVKGPTAGVYAAYVNGGFSTDATFKTDFLSMQDVAPLDILNLGLNNYTAAANLNYKQYLGTWWIQPTVGASYSHTIWNSPSKATGMIDGTNVRVQGGVRIGSGFDSNEVHFTTTLALLAYDDLIINGGTLAVATGTPLAPTDQDKIFGQAVGKIEAQFTKNWSASVEGEVRGRANVYGVAGRVGATYSFN